MTEEYNASTWTNGNNMGTSRGDAVSGGIQTNAIYAGGATGPGAAMNNTELYDGTNWTAAPTLATARFGGGTTSASGNTSAIYFGGHPPFLNNTEEFTAAATTRSVDVS